MDYENKPDGYYNNIRYEMLKYLPLDSKTVIDIGCGDGSFAQVIKERTNAEVWGIEYMKEEALKAEKLLDKVYAGPCEDHLDLLPEHYFDVVYFNDVLEHLVDPYTVLEKIKTHLKPGGIVISSIPNIRYHNALIKLFFKKEWEYKGSGVMDKTHLRFFTGKSILKMYERLGYKVQVHEGINKSKSLKPYLYNIPLFFTHLDIRYPQYATVASCK